MKLSFQSTKIHVDYFFCTSRKIHQSCKLQKTKSRAKRMIRDIENIIDTEKQGDLAWRKLKSDILAIYEIQSIKYKC